MFEKTSEMKKQVDSHLFSEPYTPKREKVKWNVRTSSCGMVHRIAYTDVLRGNDYDERVLLFQAPFMLIKDACQFIFNVMNGNIRDMVLSNEHSCRRRNGKCYWRVAVRIVDLNEQFISFREFVILLIAHIKRICNCKVRHYRPDTFINL